MKKERIKSTIIGVIIGAIIFGGIGVVAYTLKAKDISFTSTNPNWKAKNVNDALDSLMLSKTSADYSTSEKKVGTWIDGKPLYQKTLVSNTATNGSTMLTVGTIQNVDTLFIVNGFYINQNSEFAAPGSVFMLTNTGRDTYTVSYTSYVTFNPSGSLLVYYGSTTASSKTVVTVQYTKTTD